jgi:hypothetical protein
MANTTQRRCFIVALAVVVWGCQGGSLNPAPTGQGGAGGSGGATSVDASRDEPPRDTADCGCVVDRFTLIVSWDCYCAMSTTGCNNFDFGCQNPQAYPGCGLSTQTINTVGGPWIQVRDSSGTLVGAQTSSDTGEYVCPSDPTLKGFTLRAGRFPDATCEAVTCACVDGGASCPPPDAGATDARDGASNDGATCTGTPVYCALGSAGGMCSDVAQPGTCVNGQWVCPGGTVPLSQCRCTGAPPPGCSCGSTGWSCPTPMDGGAGT